MGAQFRVQQNRRRKDGDHLKDGWAQGLNRRRGHILLAAALGLIAVAGSIIVLSTNANADDTIPPEKQVLMSPSPISSTDTDTVASSPVPNSGTNSDINQIEKRLPGLLLEFNQAQILPADPISRAQTVADITTDVNTASTTQNGFVSDAGGAADCGTSGTTLMQATSQTPTSFRIAIADVFTCWQASAIALDLVAQMNDDLQDSNVPAMVSTTFTVDAWQGITPMSSWYGHARYTAVLLGEVTNCFQGGALSAQDCTSDGVKQYTVQVLNSSDSKWRINSLPSAVDADGVFDSPPPSPSPMPS